LSQYLEALKTLCASKGLKAVVFRGNTNAPCVVIGEAPGADEDQIGIPFVGASGRLQDTMLKEAGFNPGDVWFTNPYMVRPPDNDLRRLHERGIPLPTYEMAFWELLAEKRPTIIIPVGVTPLSLLVPSCADRRGNVSISHWRGSLLTSPRIPWPHYIVPIGHPAFVLRDWSERPISVLCYAKAQEEFTYWRKHGALQPLPQRQLIIEPSYSDAVEFMLEILANPLRRVSVDIEMLRCRFVYTIGLATSSNRAMSLALWDYTHDCRSRILRLLDRILQSCKQIGQNYLSFDLHWLSTIGLVGNPTLVDDTLLRHHVLWPEFPHKLEFMTMQYTREPYYKEEGKRWVPKEGKKSLLRYNARDTAVTYDVWERQEEEFVSAPI
jgi:uracil-DNA glycosylase family 4